MFFFVRQLTIPLYLYHRGWILYDIRFEGYIIFRFIVQTMTILYKHIHLFSEIFLLAKCLWEFEEEERGWEYLIILFTNNYFWQICFFTHLIIHCFIVVFPQNENKTTAEKKKLPTKERTFLEVLFSLSPFLLVSFLCI